MEVFEMSKRTYKKGIEIGSVLIKPLGIATAVVLVAVIAALVVFFVQSPATDAQKVVSQATAIPTAEPTPLNEATPVPAATATPEPTAEPTPEPTEVPAQRSATIRSLGEIAIETDLLTSAMDTETGTFDFSPMFEMISDCIGNADYTVGDVEGTLGGVSAVSGNGTTMCTPSALLTALKDCGVDMLTLANDHILDGTQAELNATMENITAAGMDYIGTASSKEERETPVIKEINGINVGFLAYTESVNGNESKLDSDAQQYAVCTTSNSKSQEDVERLRSAGADVIIAYVSWGEMLNRSATESQQTIAKMLTELKVDVIIGYNPHTVQPVGWMSSSDGSHRTLVLCATGNMLSNQRTQYFDSGLIFQFTIQEQSDGSFAIENPCYVPTYVWRYADTDRSTTEAPVYQYRVLPIAQYVSETDARIPSGMDNSEYEYMSRVLSQIQAVMDASGVATMISE